MIETLKQAVTSATEDPKVASLVAAVTTSTWFEWIPSWYNFATGLVGALLSFYLIKKAKLDIKKTKLENKILKKKVESQDLPDCNRRKTDK